MFQFSSISIDRFVLCSLVCFELPTASTMGGLNCMYQILARSLSQVEQFDQYYDVMIFDAYIYDSRQRRNETRS